MGRAKSFRYWLRGLWLRFIGAEQHDYMASYRRFLIDLKRIDPVSGKRIERDLKINLVVARPQDPRQ